MPIIKDNKLQFNTCIITYPSDYDSLLSIDLINNKFNNGFDTNLKLVIAREDPDEDINRTHYHIYYDNNLKKCVSTKYFDIPLPEPVVVFVKQDKTRTYQLLSDLASKLGGDTNSDMVPLLDKYIKEECEEGTTYDILSVAHPNIQLKKEYFGDKYLMLRYVLKQKLITFQSKDLDEEEKWILENNVFLNIKCKELIDNKSLQQFNVQCIDELLDLLRKYKLKLLRKKEKQQRTKKRGKLCVEAANAIMAIDEDVVQFRMWLREKVIEKRLTKREVLQEITQNEKWWAIYCGAYINYCKLINDMFRGKPPSKPQRHFEYTYWVPNKLFDYLAWLDKWVEAWCTGKPLEHRPKGLVLIGPSRTGKTTLISCLGEFSYFKNIWNLDCWEGKTAFTVMDDMDAGDEGKGLSFCWYKPFFGAQDAITVTDKFKPKEDIYNGKPLIWLNNYKIEESFQSKTAQDYIEKNMEIVYIHRSFKEPPKGMDIYHYKEFDPKTTWYYNNVYLKEKEQTDLTTTPTTELLIVDETQKTIDKCKDMEDEAEPLDERKKRLLKDKENGMLDKRIRMED